MNRVIAYIDGFNLYFGMKQARFKRYYWLDVAALARALLLPGQQLLATPPIKSGRTTIWRRWRLKAFGASSATTSKSGASAAPATQPGWTTKKK